MHAQLINVEDLLGEYYFQPARVQRQYVWTVSDCERLHYDLLDAYRSLPNEKYYLGPIILAKDETTKVHLNPVRVFDGQQRLTTLTIYLATIAGLVSGGAGNVAHDLSRKQLSDGEIRPTVNLQTRGGVLTRIVRNTGGRRSSKNVPVDWRILDIEGALNTCLQKVSDLDDFAAWVQKNVVLNALWADSDKGVVLFDRANNRGVQLKWYELVKGVLTDALGSSFQAAKGKRIDEFWYETDRETGSEFQGLISNTAFVRYHASNDAEAIAGFEDEFSSQKTDDELQTSGRELFRMLGTYRETATRLRSLYDYQKKIRDPSQLIEFQLLGLEYDRWKAVLMRADEYRFSKPRKLSFLVELRRVAFIAHLLDWPKWPERLEHGFKTAICELEKSASDTSANFPTLYPFTDEQLAQARGAVSGSITDEESYRPLIRIWEAERAFQERRLNGYEHFFAQIEHILPRAPREEWCDAFPDEDERAEMRNKLGNLCLLSKEDNYGLANESWTRKRATYKRASESFRGARTASLRKSWTPEVVALRTQEIANEIAELLSLWARAR